MSPREARALADGRRAELRRRARRIRRSVAAVSAALLIGLFLVIYVQLASGHDPALSASSKARTTTTSSTGEEASAGEVGSESSASESSSESSGSESGTSESSGEASQSSGSTSPMTTSQS
jgi:hypothetical protein